MSDGFKRFQQAREQTEQNVRNTYEYAKAQEDRFREHLAALETATTNYIQSGVAWPDAHARDCIGSQVYITPKQYFTELAAELNRPFLFVESERQYVGGIGYVEHEILTVPRNSKMENVVSPLLLLATNYQDGDWPNHPLTVKDSERRWRFFFVGEQGQEHLRNFVEMCKTNPIAKIILKVT